MEAIIEQKRRDSKYAGMLRRGSQTLGRHVAGAVGGYLPTTVTDMWEAKTRDFAFFKLPVPPGTKSAVALSSYSQHALVITSDGLFFQYAIDLEKGGECELVKQYSLLDTEVD
jgi:autophagy-related protein 18